LAWEGRKPIGFSEAMIRPYAKWMRRATRSVFRGLWVDPSHRRKGLGRELVDAIEVWASRRGFLELGSDAHMTANISHKAHRAYGFRETERVVYFRKLLK